MSAVASSYQDAAGSFNGTNQSQKIERVYFQVTPSGNYPAGGDPLNLNALGDLIKSSRPPIEVCLWSAGSAGNPGYTYSYKPNATPTQANGSFQVLQNGAINGPQVDIGAQAYPAGILADVILGYADFPRL